MDALPNAEAAAPVSARTRTTTTRSRKAQARIVGCLDGTGHGSLIGFATPLLYCWKPEANSVEAVGDRHLYRRNLLWIDCQTSGTGEVSVGGWIGAGK